MAISKTKKMNFLSVAIIIAAVLVSSSLIYLGTQLGGVDPEELGANIEKGIENYIEAQRQAAEDEANQVYYVDEDYSDDDPFLGDANAPITIVEFSDFECPYCQRHSLGIFPEIVKNYVETGKVKYVFRDVPLGFHNPEENPAAMREALAGNCVRELSDDATFFELHHLFFEATANSDELLSEDATYDIVAQVGVDKSVVKECVDSGKYNEEVANDLADFEAITALTGTPGFIVAGQIVPGAYPYETFAEIIDTALAKLEE